MKPVVRLDNGNSLHYDGNYPSRGWPSITWAEYDTNGRQTGIGGEVILSDDSKLNVPYEKLVLEDYLAVKSKK